MFTYDAGEEIYELHDPALRRWVMQTWSQIVDPNLSRADLPGLGDRLQLPEGWTFESRKLTSPLQIDTTTHAAQVLQDDLGTAIRCSPAEPYKYWPRFDSVSIAREALELLPVTSVRM